MEREGFSRAAIVASLALAAAPVTWQPQTSGVTGRLRGVSAVSSTVAWASGANGTVLRTTDGGTHWQQTDTKLIQRKCMEIIRSQFPEARNAVQWVKQRNGREKYHILWLDPASGVH